jgi:transglutaminase-like putative cysteine protease
MNVVISERVKMAWLAWLATVLTSLSFFPALEQKSYLFQGAFFTAIVIGVGTAFRAVRAPTVVVCLVEFLVLAELLLLRFGEDMRLGVLPTGATFDGIASSLREGIDVAQKFAAPAPANDGLLLMVLAVIAIAAIAVDTIAVGMRRVPLAGLPLLALYTIPVTILPKGLSFVVFVPGAATYVAMLMADERDRLAHWGRLVSRNSSGRDASPLDLSSLTAAGRRVSVIAVSIAVVVPILLPAISGSILDAGRNNGLGDGNGVTLSFEDPMVGLADQLRTPQSYPLLTVHSAVQPSYLRLAVLATPGPAAWTADVIGHEDLDSLSSPSKPTGLDDSVMERRSKSMTITLADDFPSDSAFLPIPFDIQSVNVDTFGYVRTDQTAAAKSQDAISTVSSYDVNYTLIDPSADQLNAAGPPPAAIADKYAHVPDLVPPEVAQVAGDVTQSGTTPYEKAQLLQSWFREPGNFRYDLTAAYGYGYGAMGQFLEQKRGFCQQFAATMAIMARTLGIPSRIVVGFLSSSTKNGDGDYVMTTKDVHAWPELYFEGVGWVKFEPTPGREAPFPTYAPQIKVPDPTSSPTSSAPTNSAIDQDTAKPSASDRSEGPQAAAGGGGSGPVAPSRAWWIALIVVALGLLPAGLRLAVRRARMSRPFEPPEAAESAWLEMRDRIRDLRLPWTGSMTPRARERAVAPLLHGDRDGLQALNRLAVSVERARYAVSLAPAASPIADAREVMSAIGRQTSRGSRLRAFLWPSSLMPDIRRGWARLTQRIRGRDPGS